MVATLAFISLFLVLTLPFFIVGTLIDKLVEKESTTVRWWDLSFLSFIFLLCLLFLLGLRERDSERKEVVRNWEKTHHIQECVDSPKHIEARKRWCSDEGWKHVHVCRDCNPYKVCIGDMVKSQRDFCEKQAGGKP